MEKAGRSEPLSMARFSATPNQTNSQPPLRRSNPSSYGFASHNMGYFTVSRKTGGKRMAAKPEGHSCEERKRMHEKIQGTRECLQTVVKVFPIRCDPGKRGATESVSARSEAKLAADATAPERADPTHQIGSCCLQSRDFPKRARRPPRKAAAAMIGCPTSLSPQHR